MTELGLTSVGKRTLIPAAPTQLLTFSPAFHTVQHDGWRD